MIKCTFMLIGKGLTDQILKVNITNNIKGNT